MKHQPKYNPAQARFSRDLLGLTIPQAAHLLGVTNDRIRAFEHSETITRADVELMAKAYDRPKSVFYEPTPPPVNGIICGSFGCARLKDIRPRRR